MSDRWPDQAVLPSAPRGARQLGILLSGKERPSDNGRRGKSVCHGVIVVAAFTWQVAKLAVFARANDGRKRVLRRLV
jgi:hypothetical protein